MNAGFIFQAQSEGDTVRLAQQMAEHASPGWVITLDGDLGAGKTRFSSSFAAALGVEETVNSPTFTIIKEYEGGKLPLYHMDVYRLTEAEADDLGLDDYFFGGGVTLLEWSERIGSLLPEERLEIRIDRVADETRHFTLIPHGRSYEQLCETLKQNGALL